MLCLKSRRIVSSVLELADYFVSCDKNKFRGLLIKDKMEAWNRRLDGSDMNGEMYSIGELLVCCIHQHYS